MQQIFFVTDALFCTFLSFFVFQTTLDKNCGKKQTFPFPPIINVVLDQAVQGDWEQQHWLKLEEGEFLRIRLCNAEKQGFHQIILCRLQLTLVVWFLWFSLILEKKPLKECYNRIDAIFRIFLMTQTLFVF